MAHIILFFLVTREDADFLDVALKEATEHRVAERTGTTGDQQGFVLKCGHYITFRYF
jgi:hypothetical protein